MRFGDKRKRKLLSFSLLVSQQHHHFKINVCSKCGYLLYGPVLGHRKQAALKAMELYPYFIICPNCGSKDHIIEINP